MSLIENEKPVAETDTSSVGPQWPPKESSFNRIKGIYNNGVIGDCQTLGDVVETLNELKDSMRDGIDRLSVRLLVTNKCFVDNIDLLANWGEAIIPLSGSNPEFEGVSIIYLGHNAQTRQPNPKDLKKAMVNVEQAVLRPRSKFSEIVKRVTDNHYSLTILGYQERVGEENIQFQMSKLYERFGWNESDVRRILARQENIIAVAHDGNKIVSAGIAEMAKISLKGGRELRMAEITEAATDANYQGRGLYSGVAATLVAELHRLSKKNEFLGGKIDMIFGECNGNEPGVLKAVRSLGRIFSYEVCKKLGLPFSGFLPQHVPIAGAQRSTPYNDLFPAFISKKGIEEFVEN